VSGRTPGGLADVSLGPYRALNEHAELELELAGRGEIARLTALRARWEELIAELPARPPAAVAPLLERAQLIHQRTRIELLRLREALLEEIATTLQARRAANGYAAQLRRGARLDRSA
jgi:GAF domain-containing protein